jgi:4-amino-4-deoxy-L-arabinose transferase-like glycosyltransferase
MPESSLMDVESTSVAKAAVPSSAGVELSRPPAARIPWAALALAAAVLLPFLTKAYTIDDPVFLREAQQLLHDPLHPTAFRMVWASERNLRASEFLPGGPLIAYLLIPLTVAGWREWAAHLLIFLYLAIAIVTTSALARRFGLSPWAQQAAAVLTATAPVALGMAGTMMPDIPAMMFVALGMERLIAWTERPRWPVGAAAAVFLALAVLARVNLVVLLAIAGYYTLRQSWVERRHWTNVLPVLCAGALALGGMRLTRDPDAGAGSTVAAVGHQLGFDFSGRHAVALLIAYLTTTPLLAALATRRGLRPNALLWVWLLIPVPVIAYVQIAPKYLLPVLPAAAILAAYGLDRLASRTCILAVLAGLGAVLGVLILRADARMAEAGRTAAAQLIRPRVQAGERVWFAGHWGFHWYAERAGGIPLTVHPPFPVRGDIIVSASVDRPVGLLPLVPKTLIETFGSTEPSGQVMSQHAGFYSALWGLLPWWWEPPLGPGFQAWRVTR